MEEKLSKPVLYTFGVGGPVFTLMINMEIYFFIDDKHILQMQN